MAMRQFRHIILKIFNIFMVYNHSEYLNITISKGAKRLDCIPGRNLCQWFYVCIYVYMFICVSLCVDGYAYM